VAPQVLGVYPHKATLLLANPCEEVAEEELARLLGSKYAELLISSRLLSSPLVSSPLVSSRLLSSPHLTSHLLSPHGRYVLISLLLIFIITGQGAVVGWFERYYCRTQAIYPTDLLASAPLANLTSSVSGTIRRRLVTASTAASATAAASSSSQLDHAVPIGYDDQDCPYTAMGPLTRFDWYDRQCAIVDMVLWLLLQLWALVLWVRGKNRLERRIEVIDRLHDGFISRDEANLYSQTDASDPEQGKPAAPSSTRADNDAEGEADASRPVERSPSDRKLCAVLKTAHLSAKRVVPLNGPAAAPLKNFAHLSDAHHRDAADELAPRDQKVAASPSAASKSPAVGAPVRMEP
jgi:hypothetical protein